MEFSFGFRKVKPLLILTLKVINEFLVTSAKLLLRHPVSHDFNVNGVADVTFEREVGSKAVPTGPGQLWKVRCRTRYV